MWQKSIMKLETNTFYVSWYNSSQLNITVVGDRGEPLSCTVCVREREGGLYIVIETLVYIDLLSCWIWVCVRVCVSPFTKKDVMFIGGFPGELLGTIEVCTMNVYVSEKMWGGGGCGGANISRFASACLCICVSTSDMRYILVNTHHPTLPPPPVQGQSAD